MPAPVLAKKTNGGGMKAYYQAKIEAAELTINQKTQNLRRLEAQRNALNARGELRTSCAFSNASALLIWIFDSLCVLP